MYKKLTLGLILVISINLSIKPVEFSIGFSPCYHHPAVNKFNQVYPDQFFAYSASAGVRSNFLMFLAKYGNFEADGASIIENAPLLGLAHWEQRNIFIGLRGYTGGFADALYVEGGMVISDGSESISTSNRFTPLASYYDFHELGYGFGMGFDIKILSFLHLDTGFEYDFIFADTNGGLKKVSPANIGGLTLSAGLTIKLATNE